MFAFLVVLLVNLLVSSQGQQVPYAKNNQSLSSCSYEATCNVGDFEGACMSVSAGCCSTGIVTSGVCSGSSSDIQCCTQSQCSTSYGSGTCLQTSMCKTKGGHSFSGICTGPSDLQCCVQDPDFPEGGHYGVDVSVPISASVASCFKENNIEYIVPRAYRSIGEVDPNACPTLVNAAKAGIPRRDVYFFPCKDRIFFPVKNDLLTHFLSFQLFGVFRSNLP
jgi:hypothetical protein